MLRIRFQSQMHVLAFKNIETLQQLKTCIKTIFLKTPKKFDLYYEVDKHLLKLQNQKTHKLNAQQIRDIIQSKTRLEIVEVHQQNKLIRDAIEFDEELIKSLQSSLTQSLHISQQNKLWQSLHEKQNKSLCSSILRPEQLQIQKQKQEWIDLQVQYEQNKSKINKKRQGIENLSYQQNLFFLNQDKNQNIQMNLRKKQVEHQVQCDNCFCFPIKNIRYKCSICSDFDLCSSCQNKLFHSHPFIKIKNLAQNPSSIQVVFDQNMMSIMKEKQQLYNFVIQNQKQEERLNILKQKQGKYVPESQRIQVNIEGNNFLGSALGISTQNLQRRRQRKMNENQNYLQYQQDRGKKLPSFS